MAEPTDHIEETPTADELAAFAKTDFYQSWKKRFDKLANLGATGVIATPNTTFDEWLYYFKQWSELYATDYQNFKDMADDAVRSLNNGYKQNKEDYALMASDIQTGFENTSQTMKDIMGDVANLKNQVNNLKSSTTPNKTLSQNLAIETNQRIAADNELQRQINSTSSAINSQLSQIKLTPEYFESVDALKAAYPNGFNGLAVVMQDSTYHAYIYQNGAFKDLGVYQQAALPVYDHDATAQLDLNSLKTGYDFFTNIENQANGPALIPAGLALVTTVRDSAGNATQAVYSEQGGCWQRSHWNNTWKNWHSAAGAAKLNPVTDLNNLTGTGTYYFDSLAGVANAPSGETIGTVIFAANFQGANNDIAGQMQLASNGNGRSYIRIKRLNWESWHQISNDASSANSVLSHLSDFSLKKVTTTDEVATGYWSRYNGFTTASGKPVQGLQAISVKPGELYQIVTSSYFDARSYIIRDSAGNIVDMYPAVDVDGAPAVSLETRNIVIPTNGAQLLVNKVVAGGTSVSRIKKIGGSDAVQNAIDTIVSAIDFTGDPVATSKYPTAGFWSRYQNGGSYFTASTGAPEITPLTPLDVKPGEIYQFTTSSYYDARAYIVLDDAGNLLKMYPDSNKEGSFGIAPETLTVVIPQGGAKLAINSITSNGITVRKMTGAKNSKSLTGYKWQVIGDSWTALHDNFSVYSDYIAQRTGITTSYKAVGGTGYIANNNGASDNFQTRSYDNNADIYTIFGSFNDAWAFSDFGSSSSQTAGSLAAAVQTTIDKIISTNTGAKIGIIAPGPWGTFNPHNTGSVSGTSITNAADFAEKYVNVLKEMAEYNSLPFLDLYHASNLKPWNSNFVNDYYHGTGETDDTHPNTNGQKIISYPIQNFIETILR